MLSARIKRRCYSSRPQMHLFCCFVIIIILFFLRNVFNQRVQIHRLLLFGFSETESWETSHILNVQRRDEMRNMCNVRRGTEYSWPGWRLPPTDAAAATTGDGDHKLNWTTAPRRFLCFFAFFLVAREGNIVAKNGIRGKNSPASTLCAWRRRPSRRSQKGS